MRDKTFAELGVLIIGAVLFTIGCVGIFSGCKTSSVAVKGAKPLGKSEATEKCLLGEAARIRRELLRCRREVSKPEESE
jgi:hypothetical protein